MPRGKPNPELREKFNRLRRAGKTYSEILKILKVSVPKGTLSCWSSRIIIPEQSLKLLETARKHALVKAQKVSLETRRKKHQDFLQLLKLKNKYLLRKINKDVSKLMLSILYLGEGSKYSARSGLALGSSDPGIIQLFIKLLKECYGKNADQLRCWLAYRADQNLNVLKKFWSNISDIPIKQFYDTKPDPRSIGKKTLKSDYKGVCVVSCLKSTKIQLELETISRLIIDN